ncbi:hypothetical protein [Rubricoccus marinus]|uniref:Uncharacterized protein n=1 Tax=Rubricoccus marinus TaxID=716817 RepID=A0A259U2F5_9BACT|nr:hypothetical protein [Rubricoccus marinus]OZC04027.1 hypothetical protein BSZ36_14165 [Rubricoccus marinus]
MPSTSTRLSRIEDAARDRHRSAWMLFFADATRATGDPAADVCADELDAQEAMTDTARDARTAAIEQALHAYRDECRVSGADPWPEAADAALSAWSEALDALHPEGYQPEDLSAWPHLAPEPPELPADVPRLRRDFARAPEGSLLQIALAHVLLAVGYVEGARLARERRTPLA